MSATLGKLTLPLLRQYVYNLLEAAAAFVKPPAPADITTLESSAVCVALTDVLRKACAAAPAYYTTLSANTVTAATAARLSVELLESLAGAVTLEVVTGVCAFWRSRAIAEAVLPALVRMVPSLRRAVLAFSPPAASTVAAVLALEKSYDALFGRNGAPPTSFQETVRSGDWVFQLLATVTWLASRLSAVLVSGVPVTRGEDRAALWLATPLFVAGVEDEALLGQDSGEEEDASVRYFQNSGSDWTQWLESNGLIGFGACHCWRVNACMIVCVCDVCFNVRVCMCVCLMNICVSLINVCVCVHVSQMRAHPPPPRPPCAPPNTWSAREWLTACARLTPSSPGWTRPRS